MELWRPEARIPRTWSIGVTAATLLSVLAAMGLPILMDHLEPPSTPVEAALRSSAGGKPSAPAASFARATTAGFLRNAPEASQFVPPSKVKVVRTLRDGNSAIVTVSYDTAGKSRTETVKVVREGVLAPWRIAGSPPVLDVTAPWPITIRVGGQLEKSPSVTVAVGVYRIEIDHLLFDRSKTLVHVGLNGGDVELAPKLSKRASQHVSNAIQDQLRSCTASSERLTLQSACPFFETQPRIVEPVSAAWDISTFPHIDVRVEDDGELTVMTKQEGRAVLTLTYEKREPRSYSCRFDVDGSLKVDGDRITWSGNPVSNLHGCAKSKR